MPIIASKRVEYIDICQGVRARMLFDYEHGDSQGISLAQGELAPGAQVFPHYHVVEEIAYIMEGKGVIAIDGVEKPVQGGDAILIPARSVHSFRNSSAKNVAKLISSFGSNIVKRFVVGMDSTPGLY